MTIAGAREKCKIWIGQVPRDVLIVGVLLLSVSASFGLGFLAGRDALGEGSGISIEVTAPISVTGPASAQGYGGAQQSSGEAKYVASKNGTKYYLTTCSGAARISEANKVWFASAASASAAGYAPAASCKGL